MGFGAKDAKGDPKSQMFNQGCSSPTIGPAFFSPIFFREKLASRRHVRYRRESWNRRSLVCSVPRPFRWRYCISNTASCSSL